MISARKTSRASSLITRGKVLAYAMDKVCALPSSGNGARLVFLAEMGGA